MNDIMQLVQVMLKQSYRTHKKRNRKQKILTVVTVIASLVYVAVMFYFSSKDLLLMLAKEGIAHEFLSKILGSMSIYLLIIAFIATPNILYFSDDLKDYLSLPIQAEDLATAKAITLYLSHLISLAFLYLPIGLVYMFVVKTSWFFFIQYLLLGFFIPMIPLSIATTLSVLIFKLFPKVKNEKLFTYASTILSLVFVFIIILGGNSGGDSLIDSLGSISGIQFLFPNLKFYQDFLHEKSILKGLLALTMILPYLLISFLVFKSSYLDTALATQQSVAKIKTNKTRNYRDWRNFLQIDQKNILRTPVLAINYLLPVVIVPVAFIAPLFIALKKDLSIGGQDLLTYRDILFVLLDSKDLLMGSIAFPLVFFLFMTSMSSVASTSFSREGQNLKHYASLPIVWRQYFLAKCVIALKVTFPLHYLILLLLMIFFRLPWYFIFIASISALLGSLVPILLGIFIDSLKPKLVWDNETEAIKKNLVSAIPAFIGMGLFFISLTLFIRNPYLITAVIYLILIFILDVILIFLINRYSEEKLLKAIEEIA